MSIKLKSLGLLILGCWGVSKSGLGMSKNSPNEELLEAAADGNSSEIQRLLQNKADIEAKHEGDGGTPLYYAAAKGHQEVVALLLGHKADVEAKDKDGGTPLHFAAMKGHQEVIALLLRHRANVGAQLDSSGISGITPLHFAASEGHQEVAALLLRHGAGIEARNEQECTPLHIAAGQGHQEVVALLLRNGANVEAKAKGDATPLHGAAVEGHQEIAKILLAHRANVGATGTNGKTPLDLAIQNNNTGIASLLKAAITANRSSQSTQHPYVDEEDPIPSAPSPFAPQQARALAAATSSSSSSQVSHPNSQEQEREISRDLSRARRWTKKVDSLRRLNVEFFKKRAVDYADQKEAADRSYQRLEEAIRKLALDIAQQPIMLQEVEQSYFEALKLLVISSRRLEITNQIIVSLTQPFVEQHSARFLLDKDEARYQSLAQGVTNITGIDWHFSFTSDNPANEDRYCRYPNALSRDGKRIWWSPEADIYCLRKHIDERLVDEALPLHPEE